MPGPTPVTTPELLTEPTVVALLDQVPPEGEPVNEVALPWQMTAVPVIVGVAFTVTFVTAAQPEMV